MSFAPEPLCYEAAATPRALFNYPDNELTGFIMLRMGQIFESRERKNEALEVYRVVMDNFKDSADLKTQAGMLARKLE